MKRRFLILPVAALLALLLLLHGGGVGRSPGRGADGSDGYEAEEVPPEGAVASSDPGAVPDEAADSAAESFLLGGVVLDEERTRDTAPAELMLSDPRGPGAPFAVTTADAAGVFLLRIPRKTIPRDARGEASFDLVARRAPDRISWTQRVVVPDDSERLWIALRMQRQGSVRAQVVDATGAPVAGAPCLLLFHPTRVEAWEIRATEAWRSLLSDERGFVRTDCPPGAVYLWARRPDGLFGARVRGVVAAGEPLDLGRVPVADRECRLTLRFEEAEGRPVPGVGVRIAAEESVQRFLRADCGDEVVHALADAHGTVELRVASEAAPLAVAVAAPGFRSLALRLDRAAARAEHRIRLERTTAFRVRLRTESGAAVPADLVRWQVFPSDLEQLSASCRGVGPDPGESFQPTEAEGDGARWVRHRFEAEPRFDGDAFRFEVESEGSYVAEAFLAGGIRRSATIAVGPGGGDPPTADLTVPDGRVVDLLVEEDPESPSFSASLYVWPATADLPPSDWPANNAEAIDATVCGSRIASAPGLRNPLWIPAWATHLSVLRLWPREPLDERMGGGHSVRGICPACGAPTIRCDHPAPGSRFDGPPGARRFLFQRPDYVRASTRAAIPVAPAGARATVVVRPPAASRESFPVAVEIRLGGLPLREAGIPVRVLTDDPALAPEERHRRGTTDDAGVVRFRLPAGEWRASLDGTVAPPGRVPFRVAPTDRPIVVPLAVDAPAPERR